MKIKKTLELREIERAGVCNAVFEDAEDDKKILSKFYEWEWSNNRRRSTIGVFERVFEEVHEINLMLLKQKQ